MVDAAMFWERYLFAGKKVDGNYLASLNDDPCLDKGIRELRCQSEAGYLSFCRDFWNNPLEGQYAKDREALFPFAGQCIPGGQPSGHPAAGF